MVSSFICGTNSFSREDHEFTKKTKSRSSKTNKNLYSTRGRDKFTALLAEIQEKRQQIYSKLDPNEISLVRFSYSGDHGFKPIIVKIKPKSQLKKPKVKKPCTSSTMVGVNEENKAEMKKKAMGLYEKLRAYQWNQPGFYLPIFVIFILVLLAIFWRSFAIICTSIGWYLIPTITNDRNNGYYSMKRVSFNKKDYATMRRLSEMKQMTIEGTTSFKSFQQLKVAPK